MKLRRFRTFDALTRALETRLAAALAARADTPRGILLAGGTTPLPAYRRLAARGAHASRTAHLLLSDERFVPEDAPESNFGQLRPLVEALALSRRRVLRPPVRGRRPERAARLYADALDRFLRAGGRIPLGVLGLGADGHTASLFTRRDVRRGGGRLAIAVRRPAGPDRISVTPALLERMDQVLVIAAGPEKREVVRRLCRRPWQVPAGRALRRAAAVEIWYAPQSAPRGV